MKDKLEELLGLQRGLQVRIHGSDPATWDLDRRVAYITEMAFALIKEVSEATDEVGWKSWATKRFIHRDAYLGELIDVQHFLNNLFLAVDASADEIADLYRVKIATNHRRQEEGYDGVSNKCPACHRAYDDAAVKCAPEVVRVDDGTKQRPWCEVYGWLDEDQVSARVPRG